MSTRKPKGWSKESREKQAKGHSNLKSYSKDDPKRASEAGKKGGHLSGITKRNNKTFKEIAKAMLGMNVEPEIQTRLKSLFPDLDQDTINYRIAGIAKQIQKMMNGDTKAFEVMRDTAGEKPVDKFAQTDSDGNEVDNKITVEFIKPK